MGLFVLPLFCLLFLISFGYSTNKHMICQDVGDATNDVHSRRLVSTRGKQGSKGERGLPGIVDYDRVQEIVRLTVAEETRQHQRKVDEMEAQIENLKSQTSESRLVRVRVDRMETQIQNNFTSIISLVVRCVDGVIHEGKCYWAEVHSSADINYAEAEKICSSKMSRLADIYGKNHCEKIMSYLRRKLNDGYSISVWTGMKKISGNNIAQLSNGSPAPYTRQRSYRKKWDDADGSRTHVYLKVMSSTSESDQGMGAFWPTGVLHGALCQTE